MALLTLNEIYASGGQMPVICLEITNAAIGTLRFVLAYEDMEIDGQTYRASAFTIQLPERSDNGFSDLSFSICGVNGECYRYIREVLQSNAPISADPDRHRRTNHPGACGFYRVILRYA